MTKMKKNAREPRSGNRAQRHCKQRNRWRVHSRESYFELKLAPLHDSAIANIVWSMAYKRGVGGGRMLRNICAILLQ